MQAQIGRDEIEQLIAGEIEPVKPQNIGRAKRIEDAKGRYVEYAKTTFPKRGGVGGLKVVVDCANGAAYQVAPEVLWELGVEVIPVGTSPNGFNINQECGSTYPQTAAEAVVAHGADLGICLDGDADRVMIIDEHGKVADGDQLMALMATQWAQKGMLKGGTLVATVMSNLGLERYLQGQNLTLLRTDVGDRYVVEAMRKGGFNLGGEQSGHIVMTDYATTGDGLIAGLQFLAAMVETGKPASELAQSFETVPQKLTNVRYDAGKEPLQADVVKAAIAAGEERLAKTGRLLIRKSGTEPLIRVMGECEDQALLDQVIGDIVSAVEAAV